MSLPLTTPEAAGIPDAVIEGNGSLCVGCNQKRLGRQLTPKDFKFGNNGYNISDFSTRRLRWRVRVPTELIRTCGVHAKSPNPLGLRGANRFAQVELPRMSNARFCLEPKWTQLARKAFDEYYAGDLAVWIR
jgi:hypothetical protein